MHNLSTNMKKQVWNNDLGDLLGSTSKKLRKMEEYEDKVVHLYGDICKVVYWGNVFSWCFMFWLRLFVEDFH